MAIAGGGIITMVIAGGFALFFPSLRRIDTIRRRPPTGPSRQTVSRTTRLSRAECAEPSSGVDRAVGADAADAGRQRRVDVDQVGELVDTEAEPDREREFVDELAG